MAISSLNEIRHSSKDQTKKKLTDILTKIFRLGSNDLDFGIYKILNYKKNEIQNFINNDLIKEITNQLNLMGMEEQKNLQLELENTKKQLIELGIHDYEKNQKYQEVKTRLNKRMISAEQEILIYNHVHTFFSRYYDAGDFFSKRRYGANERYVIPYGGEEVMMHWANSDQYYIKTTEAFNKFSFDISGLTVNFRVVEAEEEKGNTKSRTNRYFFVASRDTCKRHDNELDIFFEFRAQTDTENKTNKRPTQDKINGKNIQRIQKALEKHKEAKILFREKDGKTPLSKNLHKYTKKNTMDYFIHKDLESFLCRELDAYIKKRGHKSERCVQFQLGWLW